MIRKELENLIRSSVRTLYGDIKIQKFSLEAPENSIHGDYATNIAMSLARQLKKNPIEIASAIAADLGGSDSGLKIETAPPGFINIFLPRERIHEELKEILVRKKKYGYATRIKEKDAAINIEFISANPTGPLTLGNGRGAFFGDTLAKIFRFDGTSVIREYYINDARSSNQIQELGRALLEVGDAYPGPYTDTIRTRLKKKYKTFSKFTAEDAGYAGAQEIQNDNRKFIEKKLNIKFDVWYAEEELYKKNLIRGITDELDAKKVLYEKEGALWFRASEFGDTEDRVAIRTGGAPTYFLPDIAYHAEKLTKRKFSRVIDVLGADHHGTFPRVVAGIRALGLDAGRISALFMQIVRLVRGGVEVKMSKRRGEYVTLEELLNEVGQDAARYFFLERSPETHIDFDLDLARERSVKNPVYYIQYAHARIESIFKKIKQADFKSVKPDFALLKEKEELGLIKKLIQFPEVIEDTATDYQVHRVARYAYELARAFHNFYENHRVMTDDKHLSASRIELTRAAETVLESTLDILGISAPSEM